MKLSENFSLEEFVLSNAGLRVGIDNTPPSEVIETLKVTASKLEIVRAVLKAPIFITSGYRCLELNRLIGGAHNSQHMLGEAVDFVSSFGNPFQVAKQLELNSHVVRPDQVILSYNRWIHISFSNFPRMEILTKKDTGILHGISA